jgi:dipeptidyl aminopeptidase/acylaminoacyl peptidase
MDEERIGITGLSAGASIVFNALINSDRRFAAAIASYAPGDPISIFVGHGPWRRAFAGNFGGLPQGEGLAYMQRVSPALNAEKIEAPILLHISDTELILSMQTIATLEEEGKPVETHVFPDEYHVKWQPAHRLAIHERNIDWMNFWLRGVEDADPTKALQCERWRALRARIEALGD